MDPLRRLPPEITAEIFSYLDPITLLNASLASRDWRSRITTDSRLWRGMYIKEGWRLDFSAIRKYEQLHSELSMSQGRKTRTRHADSDASEPQLKRRVIEAGFQAQDSSNHASSSRSSPDWNEQHQPVEADVPTTPRDAEGEQGSEVYAGANSPLLIRLPNGTTKINWPYLYKQRRRLEDNWLKGRFTNFQVPHPNHIEEAHEECVYTIQFLGKWLVSGSRDKTVRVWDMDRRRLSLPPLRGHQTSVLCLQFDPSPEEDVIISGGSDRNVIIWKFSTGQKTLELTNAHHDSILNLKFNKSYLVTCSKDHAIKVWNRQSLDPRDKDYPSVLRGPTVTYPSYIIDITKISPSVLEAELASGHIKTLEPYSLLMTLDGHGAAVNAIEINDDEIVSAAGDRLIKVWSIHNGSCLRTLMGHNKGIACVQFDNRRIISGSNDDTVRIYDHASGAEVACLIGHTNLVRTVQAGFGDPPGAEEALRLEALAVDSDFWDAQRSGIVPYHQRWPPVTRRRIRYRNAGSKDPRDIMALGARIPPGGGGSRWARIVSGSYDETVIIWRQDRDGKWLVGHRLRQADAVTMANSTASHRSRDVAARRVMRAIPVLQHQTANPPTVADNNNNNNNQDVNAPGTAQPPQANQQAPPPGNHAAPNQVPLAVLQQAHAMNAAAAQAQAVHIAAHPHGFPVHRQLVNPAGTPGGSRVYKVQFDAHKILCASQDSRIVGWDFAAGDAELIEASQFFVGV
jgi:F-box and WD-40 domain protein 1/11